MDPYGDSRRMTRKREPLTRKTDPGCTPADTGGGGCRSEFTRLLGERLRAARASRGWSLGDVERVSGGRHKAAVIGAYECGSRHATAEKAHQLALFYSVTLADLLPDAELSGPRASMRQAVDAQRTRAALAEARATAAETALARYADQAEAYEHLAMEAAAVARITALNIELQRRVETLERRLDETPTGVPGPRRPAAAENEGTDDD